MNNLMRDYQAWKRSHNQHGRQAFSRFLMLRFLEGLNLVSDDYIFKGGNLLWHYIRTPRETTDLDLSTLNTKSHKQVRSDIEESFKSHSEVDFFVKDFKEILKGGRHGATIVLSFSTNSGQQNEFRIDIVYQLKDETCEIKSTLGPARYRAASIENIIADKVAAAYRFQAGNTRLKDFDDLWRISKSNLKINPKKLKDIANKRKLEFHLDEKWASFMKENWYSHAKKYDDLPANIEDVLKDINEWLSRLL